MNVLVLHFNPINLYPPAINTVKYLEERGAFVKVISRRANLQKSYGRFGLFVSTLGFHMGCLTQGFIKKWDLVIVYEHLSILPVFALRLQKRLWLHFHEYTSKEERELGGKFTSLCWRGVELILPSLYSLTHTNDWRLSQFLIDFPGGNNPCIRKGVIPNTPSRRWLGKVPKDGKKNFKMNYPIKLVYHGAINSATTHIDRLITIINQCNGRVTLDVYTGDSYDATLSKWVNFLPRIPWDDLPYTLVEYDAGLVIYNGNIPNYRYNQPNKLWEYLGCGLPVLISNEIDESMISESVKPHVTRFDFGHENVTDFLRKLRAFDRQQPRYVVPSFDNLLSDFWVEWELDV